MAKAASCAARRPRVHVISSALFHVCMALFHLPGQPARAVGLHTGAEVKPEAIISLEPDSIKTYIAYGVPYGDPLPEVYDADGLDVYGVESIVPTVRGSRKLLHGCHASNRRCATSSMCSNWWLFHSALILREL